MEDKKHEIYKIAKQLGLTVEADQTYSEDNNRFDYYAWLSGTDFAYSNEQISPDAALDALLAKLREIVCPDYQKLTAENEKLTKIAYTQNAEAQQEMQSMRWQLSKAYEDHKSTDAELEALKSQLKQAKQEVINKIMEWAKKQWQPKKTKATHGNCCTCQDCGFHHDDCECTRNDHKRSALEDLEDFIKTIGDGE